MESFTVFVILPTEDVCSIRNLTSGLTVRHIRFRLEMMAGLPGQTYKLLGSQGQCFHDDHQLVLHSTVWDGFLFRAQMLDSWLPLYEAVRRGDVSWVIRDGAVYHRVDPRLGVGEEGASDAEVEKTISVVCERGVVALFMASWHNAAKICQGLLTVGVNPNGRTPFGRTPAFAAAYKDNDTILECLLTHGAKLSFKDSRGDTCMDLARRNFSRQCINRIRTFQLVKRGHSNSRSKSPSLVGPTPSPRANRSDLRSVDGSVTSSSRDRPPAMASSFKTPPQYKTEKFSERSMGSTSLEQGRKSLIRADTNRLTSSQDSLPARQNSGVTSPCKGSVDGPGCFRQDAPTRQQAVGVRFRIAVPPVTDKPSTNSPRPPSVLTLSDAFTSSELITIKPARREGKFQPQKPGGYQASSAPHEIQWYHHESVLKIPNPEPPERPSTARSVRTVSSIMSAPGVSRDATTMTSDNRSVESAPHFTPTDAHDSETDKGSRNVTSGKRYLLVSRQKQHESWKTAKRRIRLAEQQKRSSGQSELKKRETFDEWLNRKRMAKRQESSEGESGDSESDEEKNANAFQEWLKEVRLRPGSVENPKSAVHLQKKKSRPLKGLIEIEKLGGVGERQNSPKPSSYMNALNEWRARKKKMTESESEKINDAVGAKKALEEKRQKLLAMAITYDEWMEHTEERKTLMKLILQADKRELEELEKTRFTSSSAGRAMTFQQWREKTEERERKQKAEQLRLRKKQEDEKREGGRNSTALSHQEWVSWKSSHQSAKPQPQHQQQNRLQQQHHHQKKQQQQQQQQLQQQRSTSAVLQQNELPQRPSAAVRRAPEDVTSGDDSAFRSWVNRKYKEEASRVEANIRRERQMVLALREKRQTAEVV
ncbi:heat shock protein DDB_G0288861 [Aplysia californica]|uniref:Heat shock protein DDB_G0288861 n=1 Tax=Aplysia californica TaxID=6500 RepID=A0ABM0JZG9_APLCA|nr:heat shock protein DDB_G0288861 [Aplysia californica]